MNGSGPLLLLVAIVFGSKTSQALQSGPSTPEILITKLPPPIYPPIARAARVWGEVQISLKLRPDGTIASAEAVSGPPMLRQPAVDAVKQTHLECEGCLGDLTSVPLTFRFELLSTSSCEVKGESYPGIAQSHATITVQDQAPLLCDPMRTATKTHARSPKCLYLWKCGWRRQPSVWLKFTQ